MNRHGDKKILCRVLVLVSLYAVAGLNSSVLAQKFDERFTDWPVDLKINGRILLCGGEVTPELALDFLGDDKSDDRVQVWIVGKPDVERVSGMAGAMVTLAKSVTFINYPDAESERGKDNFDCEMIVMLAGNLTEAQAGSFMTRSANNLEAFVGGGGFLAVDGVFAPSMGRLVIGADTALETGINLIPDTVISIVDDSEDRETTSVRAIVAENPRTIGLQLDQTTALLFTGRKMLVMNDGTATFVIPACQHLPERIQTIQKPEDRGQPPHDFIVDWTEWRRDSIERTLEPFPPAAPEKPFVENGTLLIVGGGGIPDGMMEQFIELAGGKDAHLVYVPCSEDDEVSGEQGLVSEWEKAGVASATMIHTKNRVRANTDEEFFAPLKKATGIFFGGGRQWNFSDSYYGTKTHELMKGVLHRGGVIAGSSAGASIQARYLARATPIGNFRIMAPGYERGGLGFLGGVAIDQHFSQRGRQKDMTSLVDTYPQLLGIGIDEGTAIVVRKSQAEIVGMGKVFFYDRNQPVVDGEPDFIALPAGSVFDLAERKALVDGSKSENETDK